MSHNPNDLGKSAQTRIHNITGTQVQELLAKLDVLEPQLFNLDFPFEELGLSDINYLPQRCILSRNEDGGKHALQENSILGYLQRALGGSFFFQDRGVLRAIELGSGKGRLSDRLQQLTDCRLDHILIDRQEFHDNHCKDRVLRARSKQQNNNNSRIIQRVVVDIGSLDLQKYCPKDQKYFCMSKHLCGPASDLSIASIARMEVDRRPSAAAIATCCHYLCTWDSFQGRSFWNACGLTKNDFIVAVTASQWASLESKKKKDKKPSNDNDNPTTGKRQRVEKSARTANAVGKEKDGEGDDLAMLPDLQAVAKIAQAALHDASTSAVSSRKVIPSNEFERLFSRNEKVQFGVRLKRLLDLARAATLQELGYRVQLVRYTTQSIEDRLLVLQLPD